MGKIYTKTGDAGTTGTLFGRVGKSEQLTVTLGTLDELNSWIGYLRSIIKGKRDKDLKRIQDNLMTITAELAGSKIGISKEEVTGLEIWIDGISEKLPTLTNFVFPYGAVHVARAVARRAEREVVKLAERKALTKEKQRGKIILAYMNRLSDALFVLARAEIFDKNIKEEVWKK